ncbi:hypothetical protein IQ244_24255 [Nostoc sp. LEGE 06077]|uniref:hypothetical protein n=1 Tax=Nostoc sp. LEGE 06077 TaxID=915325 RepID=UPI001881900F|nr:hypothetical protein [Nostoc sp. LEGE 06077]MBE9209555.1 hypothetical protein [Nostoc sp. LEGE 06077]
MLLSLHFKPISRNSSEMYVRRLEKKSYYCWHSSFQIVLTYLTTAVLIAIADALMTITQQYT